jgi:hypothetical protein
MSEQSLIEKAYSRYMRKGDYGLDVSTLFPLIVQDNSTKNYTRLCEVFGLFHEWGSVYSMNLRPLTKEEFERAKQQMNSE